MSGFDLRTRCPANALLRPSFKDFPAVAARLAKGKRTSIAFLGDSTGSEGWGAEGDPGGAGVAGDENNARREKSWVALLRNELKARGIATRADAVIGAGTTSANTPAQFMAKVPHVSMGAGWNLAGTVSVGGRLFENSTTTNPWIITPEIPAIGIDLYYVRSTGFDTFTVSDAGGQLASVNAAGSLAFVKLTVRRANASMLPFLLARTNTVPGGNMRLCAAIPFDDTGMVLEFWPMGWAGSQTTNWISATSAVAPLNALPAFVPTQWVVELGANDINAGLSAATFGTQMGTLVDRLRTVAVPDVPVSFGIPPAARDNSGSYNIPETYVAQLAAIKAARASMTPDFNFRGRARKNEFYFDSSVHRTFEGNADRVVEALRVLA